MLAISLKCETSVNTLVLRMNYVLHEIDFCGIHLDTLGEVQLL